MTVVTCMLCSAKFGVALVAVCFKNNQEKSVELLHQCSMSRDDLLSCLAVFLVPCLRAVLPRGLLCSEAEGSDLCEQTEGL